MPPLRISNGDAMPKSTTSSERFRNYASTAANQRRGWQSSRRRSGEETAPAATYAIMAA